MSSPPVPVNLNEQLSDWELFRTHCLHNGHMHMEALGDLWNDAALHHIQIALRLTILGC